MPCYHPKRVCLDPDGHVDWSTFNRESWAITRHERAVNIPCGSCFGCNAAQKRDWSLRIFHEASLHFAPFKDTETGVTTTIPNSCILTLTYNDEHIPNDGALRHDDFQRFMKRLRKFMNGRRVRFFMAGEYGGKTHRPHYHVILMGVAFEDRYTEITSDGQRLSCSTQLDRLWSQRPFPASPPTNMGRATVEEFTFAGAAYAAGHIAKKQGDSFPGPFHESVDRNTGEVTTSAIQPEYRKMSTHPGLGFSWLMGRGSLDKRFICQIPLVYERDYCTIGEWKYRPPAYYDRLLRRYRPDLLGQVLRGRETQMFESADEWDPERCGTAEAVALANLQQRRDSL